MKTMSGRKKTYFSNFSIFILVVTTSVIIILVVTTSVIFLNFSVNTAFYGLKDNALIATVNAQSDLSTLSPEELQQQAKDYLSTLMELQNQTDTNDSSLEGFDNTGANNETDLATPQLA